MVQGPVIYLADLGAVPKLGVPFVGPHDKDSSIFGSILGLPDFWETTIFSL